MKSRVMTFVLAVCLMAVVAGSAEAARKSVLTSRVQPSGIGTVISGSPGTYDAIWLLKLWKSGYRYYFKV